MINGYCDERFNEAKNIFESSIKNGFELGGGICIEVKGEKVIDIWGGHLDHEKTQPWKENTIVNVFSTTKGIAAICLLQLIEKGLLDIDRPVADYWPEFSANGKEKLPVKYLFCHKSRISCDLHLKGLIPLLSFQCKRQND